MKYRILAGIAALSIAFAFGRYSVKSVDKTMHADIEKTTDTHKVTIIEDTPQGKKTTITEDTGIRLEKIKNSDSKVVSQKSGLNISALVGVDSRNSFQPVFGASMTKEFIGPITAGLWATTNGIVGISAGLSF